MQQQPDRRRGHFNRRGGHGRGGGQRNRFPPPNQNQRDWQPRHLLPHPDRMPFRPGPFHGRMDRWQRPFQEVPRQPPPHMMPRLMENYPPQQPPLQQHQQHHQGGMQVNQQQMNQQQMNQQQMNQQQVNPQMNPQQVNPPQQNQPQQRPNQPTTTPGTGTILVNPHFRGRAPVNVSSAPRPQPLMNQEPQPLMRDNLPYPVSGFTLFFAWFLGLANYFTS